MARRQRWKSRKSRCARSVISLALPIDSALISSPVRKEGESGRGGGGGEGGEGEVGGDQSRLDLFPSCCEARLLALCFPAFVIAK